jgi:hypothetical protein
MLEILRLEKAKRNELGYNSDPAKTNIPASSSLSNYGLVWNNARLRLYRIYHEREREINPASVKISDRFPRNAASHPTSTIRRFRAIGDKKMSFARNKNNLVPCSENYQSIARKWVIFQSIRDLGRAKRTSVPTRRPYPRGTTRRNVEDVARVLLACLPMSRLIVMLVYRLNIHEISRRDLTSSFDPRKVPFEISRHRAFRRAFHRA